MNAAAESFWRGRRVLVTGCSGLLGSWLTARLVEVGARVVGLVRDWVPESLLVRSGTIDRIATVRGSITDGETIDRIFPEYEIQTCFHLAAMTVVSVANQVPVPALETNVRGTWLLLEAARQWGRVEQLVVASSDKAYGTSAALPYTETSPLAACHPYDASKACADILARTYAHSYGIPIAVTRCANIYGGGDLNWSRIIPGTIRSVLSNQRPVIRSDGTMRRDYVYVRDVVAAYLTLAEAMRDGAQPGAVFNLGGGAPRTVLEVVRTIIRLSEHPQLEPVVLGAVSNEIQDQYLSAARAQAMLGWTPRFTLEDGLREALAWYRDVLAGSTPPAPP